MNLINKVLQDISMYDWASITSIVALLIVFVTYIKVQNINKAIKSDRERMRELLNLPEVNSILWNAHNTLETILHEYDDSGFTNDMKKSLGDACKKLVKAQSVLGHGMEQIHGHNSKDLHEHAMYCWERVNINEAMKYAKKALDSKNNPEHENRERRQQCYNVLIEVYVLTLKRKSAIYYFKEMKEQDLKPDFPDKYLENNIYFIVLWINSRIRLGFRRFALRFVPKSRRRF